MICRLLKVFFFRVALTCCGEGEKETGNVDVQVLHKVEYKLFLKAFAIFLDVRQAKKTNVINDSILNF